MFIRQRIVLTLIFMMSYGITNQVLAKEEGKIQEDEFGTKPTLNYLAKDVTFLDELKRKLYLTPEQMEKMGMIIKAEQDAIASLQQKWMQILKDEKLSVEQKRKERDNMDKEIISIAKKTKTDVEETLTTFQYNEFTLWIKEKMKQAEISLPTPQEKVNPFKEAFEKNKEIKESLFSPPPTRPTDAQQEIIDEFRKAVESHENPFDELSDDESEGLEDIFTLEGNENESLINPFEEGLQKDEGKKE